MAATAAAVRAQLAALPVATLQLSAPPPILDMLVLCSLHQPKSANYRIVFFSYNKSTSTSVSVKNTASRTQPWLPSNFYPTTIIVS
jgi:hypothetical protein